MINMEQHYTEQYRPLSPWAYFGLNILFSIPVVGFVFLLVFTFSNKNINRRNYARSFWCSALLALFIIGLCVLFAAIFGISYDEVAGTFIRSLN